MEEKMQPLKPYSIKTSSSEVLASNICELIVNERMTLGDHLKEIHFAEKLKVSRTLIRSAFKALEEMGILERRPNRGFFLRNPEIASTQLLSDNSAPLPNIDLPPLCYQLAHDYLNKSLPSQIAESDIVRKYNESRIIVQQALNEMEKEGWIQRLLGYGWEFNEFLTSSNSYEQCYRFRSLIEPAALREPNYCPNYQVLDELKKRQQKLLSSSDGYSPSQIFNAGAELHEAIVSFSGNQFLIKGIQNANRLRRLLEYSVHPTRTHPQRECEDHLHLIGLIESGEYGEAACFLEVHLTKAREVKTAIVRKMLG